MIQSQPNAVKALFLAQYHGFIAVPETDFNLINPSIYLLKS